MQSSSQIVTANKPISQLFTGRIRIFYLSPIISVKSTEKKTIASHSLVHPKFTWESKGS